MKKPRVLLFELREESNTFNPVVMSLADFTKGKKNEGAEAYAECLAVRQAVLGATDAITAYGGEVIPTVFLRAPHSGGRIADEVVHFVCDKVRQCLEEAGEIDAVFGSLHGATCAESYDDACGEILRFVRNLVGDKPMAVSCDFHAKVTDTMLECANVITGYQTYPHMDLYETAHRAGTLLMKKLAGESFCLAAAAVPMLIPPAGYTTNEGALKALMDCGHTMVNDGTLLDFSIFAVQPWLDVPEICSRVLAVAEDASTAKEKAELLAQKLWDLRDETMPEMLTVDEILDIVEKNDTGKVVVLAETSDSPNGGALGDSPVVALRYTERGCQLRVGMFIKDPMGVMQAFALGVGGTAEFSLGAGYTVGMPGPFKAVGTVRSLHDGRFILEGPSRRGLVFNIGKAAVVSFGNLDILVCEEPTLSGDPQIFRHFGIEPTMYDVIVVKANTSFRVPYSKISDLIYVADTPGACGSNLQAFHWEHLPKGLYPMDPPDEYRQAPAKIYR